MSSILGAPPRSIDIGGPGGPDGPGPGGPPPGLAAALAGGPDDAGPGDPDASHVTGLLRQALTLVQQAARLEADDTDAASLSDIAARIHKAISAEQAGKDAALGAGPAVKMLRKASSPGGAPRGGGGGY